jgi:hypothetical protein
MIHMDLHVLDGTLQPVVVFHSPFFLGLELDNGALVELYFLLLEFDAGNGKSAMGRPAPCERPGSVCIHRCTAPGLAERWACGAHMASFRRLCALISAKRSTWVIKLPVVSILSLISVSCRSWEDELSALGWRRLMSLGGGLSGVGVEV